MGLVQKCGGSGVVSPDHCATRVRTRVIFIGDIVPSTF